LKTLYDKNNCLFNSLLFFFGGQMALERNFQSKLISRLYEIFPEAIVLKNDANYLQGFPDITILYGNRWAVLETKREKISHRQPNQGYYVKTLNDMSFSRFVNPDNVEEVLSELQEAFRFA
jgi:hypothetical protein